jgi:ADP-heptose:LPS heptosyltransferase
MKRAYIKKDKILLVNITRLGDMIQATPTIAGLKMENPGCHITVLVEKAFAEVCSHLPYVDEIVSLDLSMVVQALSREGEGILDAFEYFSSVVDKLKNDNYDFCLNMSNSAYTALLLRLVGIKRMGGWVADSEGYRRIESDWARLFASNVFFRNRHYNSLNLVDIFRASADVDQHPETLVLNVQNSAVEYVENFLTEERLVKNGGPLVAIQVGASQAKRQWSPHNFSVLIDKLVIETNAQVVLTGTKSELPIIAEVVSGLRHARVIIAAGKTNIPQLAALLSLSDILVTGDTGTMHIGVAVKTPVVALFLASAYCFETGPYSAGNLIVQPTLECGPCNPNKLCSRPDCHDLVKPDLIVELVKMRLNGNTEELKAGVVDSKDAIVYRSEFDEFGFLDLVPLNTIPREHDFIMQEVYRRLWMDDIGGMLYSKRPKQRFESKRRFPIAGEDRLSSDAVEALTDDMENIKLLAQKGAYLIDELNALIGDVSATGSRLAEVNYSLSELDRKVEQFGLSSQHLGPLTRMFVFARENLQGDDAYLLAEQMKSIYIDLERRSDKLKVYYRDVLAS